MLFCFIFAFQCSGELQRKFVRWKLRPFKCVTLIFLDTVQPNTRPKETPDTSRPGLMFCEKFTATAWTRSKSKRTKETSSKRRLHVSVEGLLVLQLLNNNNNRKSTFWINNFQFYKTEHNPPRLACCEICYNDQDLQLRENNKMSPPIRWLAFKGTTYFLYMHTYSTFAYIYTHTQGLFF